MYDAITVNIRQSVEYIIEDRSYLGIGERPTLEESGQGQGHIGEDEGEAVFVVAEGLKKWYAWLLQLSEDLGLTGGIVRLNAVGLSDYFQGTVFVAIDLGCDAAGDVLAISVRAYPLSRFLVRIVIAAFRDGAIRIRR